MAKQSGIMPIEGTIGNLTFVRTADGFRVRAKGGVSRQRIMNDPAFARTRENIAEFGAAGKASKLLRGAFHNETYSGSDKRMTARLTRRLHQVLKTDPVNPRGQRDIAGADLSLLTGFEFNSRSTRESVLSAEIPVAIDRATGTATLTVSPFVPAHQIRAPRGTTHFCIVFAAAEVDFARAQHTTDRVQTPLQVWDTRQQLTLQPLVCDIPEDGTQPVVAVMGILFYQEHNGTFSPLKNGAYSTMSIVQVKL